jgi:hypothetical protein
MSARKHIDSLSRRDVLLGGGVAIASARGASAQTPSRPARAGSKFDVERFIEDCTRANEGTVDAQSAVRYGGDFFAVPRSEWDPETLTERDWDIQRAIRIFRESNERFFKR